MIGYLVLPDAPLHVNRNYFITVREREALVSLIAIRFVEEHGLLNAAQIEDAKRSLQALFLRASGEETLLRKLIDLLKATRHIHSSFASISGTLGGVAKCIGVLEDKQRILRTILAQYPISVEANTAFVGPFLSFSQAFLQHANAFADTLSQYLDAREQEARAQSMHRIAVTARERLRQRLAGRLGEVRDEMETRIKNEVIAAFDYAGAEEAVTDARYARRDAADAVQENLQQLRILCRAAVHPAGNEWAAANDGEADLLTRFHAASSLHPCLAPLNDVMLELFRLYQHTHGVFQLDYQKLEDALDTVLSDPAAYFQSKEEDVDLARKREKLHKIERLIAFLEQATRLMADEHMDAYPTFSRQLSAVVSERRAPWNAIAEGLLRAKVQAEAEISSRL